MANSEKKIFRISGQWWLINTYIFTSHRWFFFITEDTRNLFWRFRPENTQTQTQNNNDQNNNKNKVQSPKPASKHKNISMSLFDFYFQIQSGFISGITIPLFGSHCLRDTMWGGNYGEKTEYHSQMPFAYKHDYLLMEMNAPNASNFSI